MGVLDELQKEADAIAAEKKREAAARAAELASAREQIAPRMQAAYKYFEQLKQHLQAGTREIHARYGIQGAGQVDGLLQGRYSVSTETPDTMEKFTFRCVCAKAGAFQVNIDDPAVAAGYRCYLRDNGLNAKTRDLGRGKTAFLVQHAVPVVVEFSTNLEKVAITLRVRNLTALGVSRHTLTPDQLDEEFLDELAKAILRTEHRFEEMVGDVLSKTGQVRLKTKIQTVMRQKEIEDQQLASETDRTKTFARGLTRTLFGRKESA